MSTNFLHINFLERFTPAPTFTRQEVYSFFQKYEPDISEGAVAWRIYDLRKQNLLRDVKRGVYSLTELPAFTPPLSEELLLLNSILHEFSDSNSCNIWDTKWVNDFVELQTTSSMVVVEVEKEIMDSVFYAFKDRNISEVYIKPDSTVIQKYVSEANRPVVIKPIVSRSPLQTIQDVKVPTLEKILVDIFCDDKLYYAFQGNQLQRIYEKVVTSHPINFSTLFTYAKRRNREPQIKSQFLHLSNKDIKRIIG